MSERSSFSDYAPPPRRPEPQRISGVNAVRALFLRRPEAVQRLHYLAERRPVAGPLCRYLARHHKAYREVLPDELARIAGTEHHGGIVAIADPRRAEPLGNPPQPILFASPILPVLDGIGNPHNLGAIARGAAFFGAKAMLLSGDARQADLSDAAFRTSEGALEHLAVIRADSLAQNLRRLSGQLLTVGAAASGGVPPEALPRGKPIALVLGHEENGLSPDVLAACEMRVTLPGSGLVESLNVAAAAAVLMHALTSARRQAT
ncbi:TrmH family RNA methyltransferase [Roseococcus pinisoli]|uniref:RNA methyltransferase n=1 Tax=Roseococcus pinisoli TaxID=2835040 RepID=A0ABS5Q9M5_9PROT|nr:RNA methyltransferase [Roseococcus pinisoli]MBS7810182.1 RNA methyltransferase [Roseococcus pinisoli]